MAVCYLGKCRMERIATHHRFMMMSATGIGATCLDRPHGMSRAIGIATTVARVEYFTGSGLLALECSPPGDADAVAQNSRHDARSEGSVGDAHGTGRCTAPSVVGSRGASGGGWRAASRRRSGAQKACGPPGASRRDCL